MLSASRTYLNSPFRRLASASASASASIQQHQVGVFRLPVCMSRMELTRCRLFTRFLSLIFRKNKLLMQRFSALCTTMILRFLIHFTMNFYVAHFLARKLQILEREKDKNLRRSKNDQKPSIHKYAPGWNEMLASASEGQREGMQFF